MTDKIMIYHTSESSQAGVSKGILPPPPQEVSFAHDCNYFHVYSLTDDNCHMTCMQGVNIIVWLGYKEEKQYT